MFPALKPSMNEIFIPLDYNHEISMKATEF